MIVLGVDPGTTHSAIALVSVPERGQPRYLGGATVESHRLAEKVRLFERLDVVGIEMPSTLFGRGQRRAAMKSISMHLQTTGKHAQALVTDLESRGQKHTLFASVQWRAQVIGDSKAGDKAIRHLLTAMVAECPARTEDDHARDAIGVALAAAWAEMRPAMPARRKG